MPPTRLRQTIDPAARPAARLNACRIAVDASTEGDPGLACQRDPSKFDRSCAQLSSCREVVACLAR